MTRCKVWIVGQSLPQIVNASAETVVDQVNGNVHDLLVPMIVDEHPDEIDRGIELTIWISPDHVFKVEPILQDT